MSDVQQESVQERTLPLVSCELDAEGHCITCSDEAVEVVVLRADAETETAQVKVQDRIEEIDISLVEHCAPGSILLVHGGVAIAYIGEASEE